MSKKKKDLPPRVDHGTVVGSLVASGVLLLWLFTLMNSGEQEVSMENAVMPAPLATTVTTRAPSPATVASPNRTTQESALSPAIQLGKEGLDQLKEAYKWQDEIGGNPFYFRGQCKEATQKLEGAIEQLDELLQAGSLSSSQEKSAQGWRDHFAKSIGYTRK
jgi:hypothetical protein